MWQSANSRLWLAWLRWSFLWSYGIHSMQQKQRFKVLKKKTQILQLFLYFLLDSEIFKATEKLGSWNLQGYVSPQNTYVTCDLFQQLESNVIRVNIVYGSSWFKWTGQICPTWHGNWPTGLCAGSLSGISRLLCRRCQEILLVC